MPSITKTIFDIDKLLRRFNRNIHVLSIRAMDIIRDNDNFLHKKIYLNLQLYLALLISRIFQLLNSIIEKQCAKILMKWTNLVRVDLPSAIPFRFTLPLTTFTRTFGSKLREIGTCIIPFHTIHEFILRGSGNESEGRKFQVLCGAVT